MKTRRDFIKMSAVAGTAIAGATVATSSLARLPDPVIQTSPNIKRAQVMWMVTLTPTVISISISMLMFVFVLDFQFGFAS